MPRSRTDSLDVLRCIAVTLVLFRHAPPNAWPRLGWFGWTGVDLFFVLSGFLVAGLLLDEREQHGRADVVRFLARRGFKIYPSFWLFLAATLAYYDVAGKPYRPAQVLCELAFLQNYGPGFWAHTWSLAVEEHFYFLLAGGFALWQRRAGRRRVSVAALCAATAAVLAAVLAVRSAVFLLAPARYKLVYFGTHARIDAPVFGALLAALYRREGPRLRALLERRGRPLLAATALGALPSFVLPFEHAYTRTVGYTFVYLFFGVVLLLAVTAEGRAAPGRSRPLLGAMTALGRHSYGIYLWHNLAYCAVRDASGGAFERLPPAAQLAAYLALSVAVGVTVSRLVEQPFLALRDRLLPRHHRGLFEAPLAGLDARVPGATP